MKKIIAMMCAALFMFGGTYALASTASVSEPQTLEKKAKPDKNRKVDTKNKKTDTKTDTKTDKKTDKKTDNKKEQKDSGKSDTSKK